MSLLSIKNALKQNSSLVRWILAKKIKWACKENIIQSTRSYENRYIKHSTSLSNVDDPLSLRRRIIINSHILEKGLSHSDYRPGFGKLAIEELQNCLKQYVKTETPDMFAVDNAVSLLRMYHELNRNHGFDDSDYVRLNEFDDCLQKDISPYTLIQENGKNDFSFSKFAQARHSIRSYDVDGLPLEDILLEKVTTLANTAPSACNRQATHLFVARDRQMLQEIEKIHGGCKGFGKHVSAFVFVTSDLSLYSSNEVKIPAFDAGIYTLNLLYALQAYGLYSCALNGSFPGIATDQIRVLTGIPERYEIQGLVAVYKLPDNSNIKIAASPRRDQGEVLTFIN